MTDEQILAHYRQRNPYIPLSLAKKYHREEMKWWHLTARSCASFGYTAPGR
jgi:hypothetical protein